MPRRKHNVLTKAWRAEPAVIVSLATALITLAVSFGLKLTEDQTAAIVTVVGLLAGLITRSQVSPKARR